MGKKDENLVLIDADSIIYIVGYELADIQLEPLGILKLDEFIKDILIATGSKDYLGFYGGNCGRNFRKDIAVTKEYKGNRSKEKEEWYEFWEPILKERMNSYWGFQPVCKIEADDACSIAANKYRGQYKKVIVASPDKDLFQIPDTWFYDYNKRVTVFCNETVSMHKLCAQLIMGDSSDNIPGCFGAGTKVANDFIIEAINDKYEITSLVDKVKDFYVEWHTVKLLEKAAKKQEKEYLIKYKKDNDISRFTAAIKSDALKLFIVDTSNILSKVDSMLLFTEMYKLIKLLDTEEEGEVFDFIMTTITTDSKVNWEEIIIFQDDLEGLPEQEDFDFLEEL